MSPKTLVIFYSFEGNTRFIAETMASQLGADLLELRPKRDIGTKGTMKYVWGGRQVLFRKRPELEPLERDPAGYELIFIGTPVWFYTYAPALRTFFSTHNLKGKRVALFCCHEGGMKDTLDMMEKALVGNQVVDRNDFFAPLKRDKAESEARARAWCIKVAGSAKERAGRE